MNNQRDYNAAQLQAGRLTIDHVTALVEFWQRGHRPLEVDGMAGPATTASLDRARVLEVSSRAAFIACPLPVLADGRRAVITSGFRPRDRPDHNGCDWLYPWRAGDEPHASGDHGAEGRNADGTPRWVVPVGVPAVAAAAGVVTRAAPSRTGHVVWIDHGNGLRTGYFHLLEAVVERGQHVIAGDHLGPVGDNPADVDGRHLHFELSPVATYSPMDPEPYLIR